MKKSLLFFFLLISNFAWSQADTGRLPEPDLETSHDNQELLIIALVGLVILLALYFLFRRSKRFRR
jgi:LPXTG-motif cell wall-anchored protein